MPHKMNLQPSKRILRQFSAACLFVGGLSCWRLWSEGPTIVRYGSLPLHLRLAVSASSRRGSFEVFTLARVLSFFPLGGLYRTRY